MLGEKISDLDKIEDGGVMRGMELLPVVTELKKEKVRCQTEGTINKLEGACSVLSGASYTGYEIHMGKTDLVENGEIMKRDVNREKVVIHANNQDVYGTYIHGIFDRGSIALSIVKVLAERKGIQIENGMFEDYESFKEKQYDQLADTLREYLNMEEIYEMLGEAHLE